MKLKGTKHGVGALSCLTLFLLLMPSGAYAGSFKKGPETCQSCHKAEFDVWQQTKHFQSFREVHRNPKAKEILAAVGGSPNMRANAACVLCHFTVQQETAEARPVARQGPSCESCHGASSDWLALHNDYGGPSVTKETETPEHKARRFGDAEAAGWIHSSRKYDLASNCMACHGLAQPALDGETIGKMLAAGHPLRPEFELVQYSQGSVRHRFYPPDITVNAEMTPEELARFFAIGQAAKLVSAALAQTKSNDPDYQAAQTKRAEDTVAVLSALKSVPEAAALIQNPTEENARKFVSAIADKDLSGEIGNLLPEQATYK